MKDSSIVVVCHVTVKVTAVVQLSDLVIYTVHGISRQEYL